MQLIYRTSHADGERLVADPRIGATGYTGSRGAGLKLKAAADAAGKPIYLELSSVNPVVILPGALGERRDDIADEFADKLPDGNRPVLHEPRPGAAARRRRRRSSSSSSCAERFDSARRSARCSRKAVAKSLDESVDNAASRPARRC